MCKVLVILFFCLQFCSAEQFFITVGGINGEQDGHKLEGQFGTIYKSADLKNWQEVFKGGPVKDDFNHAKNNMLRCMTYGNGVFIATGNPKCVLRSTDGQFWQEVETPSGSMSVGYGNGIFLAANASSFMTSKDGLNWESTKQPGKFKVWGKDGAGHVRKTIFGNGVFILYGEQRISITKDGKTFLKNEIIQDKGHRKSVITFGNGRFIWLNPINGHKISEDGLTWKSLVIDESTAKQQTQLLWTGEKFFVKGDKFIYSSIDGESWEKKEANTQFFTLIAAGNNQLVNFAGWDSGLSTSDDEGVTWEKQGKLKLKARKFYFFNGKEIIGQNGG
ncbi:MAG: hypothetical protein NE334_05815 [Lentisphaeraceae bacterium]|nr:hypothetical protein [Lentisphaeraceae bacterium]